MAARGSAQRLRCDKALLYPFQWNAAASWHKEEFFFNPSDFCLIKLYCVITEQHYVQENRTQTVVSEAKGCLSSFNVWHYCFDWMVIFWFIMVSEHNGPETCLSSMCCGLHKYIFEVMDACFYTNSSGHIPTTLPAGFKGTQTLMNFSDSCPVVPKAMLNGLCSLSGAAWNRLS